MRIKNTILSYALFALSNNQISRAANWNYLQNGKDWPNGQDWECNQNNQAPINLQRSLAAQASDTDAFQKHFQDFDGTNAQIDSSHGAFSVSLPEFSETRYCTQYFVSNHQKQAGGNKRFDAGTIVFRSDSEHTIDEQRMGLEMQVSTQAGADGAMMAVLFDVAKGSDNVTEEVTGIIDAFFESLALTEALDEWAVADVPFGQLMSALDTENRWVYQARDNKPPCQQNTYYHVLSNVYPIKEEHLELVKAQISRVPGVAQPGNYRVVQQYNSQNVKLFFKDRTPLPPATLEDEFQVVLADLFLVILIIWCCIAVLALFWLIWKCIQRVRDSRQQKSNGHAIYKPNDDGTGKVADGVAEGTVDTGRQIVGGD